jgi:hypothetical protein
VLGVDESVLAGADEPERRSVLRVERRSVQVLGQQDLSRRTSSSSATDQWPSTPTNLTCVTFGAARGASTSR